MTDKAREAFAFLRRITEEWDMADEAEREANHDDAGCEVRPLCEWRERLYGYWETGCGKAFQFIDGGPKENSFVHCPYCGDDIKDIRATAADSGKEAKDE